MWVLAHCQAKHILGFGHCTRHAAANAMLCHAAPNAIQRSRSVQHCEQTAAPLLLGSVCKRSALRGVV